MSEPRLEIRCPVCEGKGNVTVRSLDVQKSRKKGRVVYATEERVCPERACSGGWIDYTRILISNTEDEE
jgi:hypothetical protein